jgi:hypothetical protein
MTATPAIPVSDNIRATRPATMLSVIPAQLLTTVESAIWPLRKVKIWPDISHFAETPL